MIRRFTKSVGFLALTLGMGTIASAQTFLPEVVGGKWDATGTASYTNTCLRTPDPNFYGSSVSPQQILFVSSMYDTPTLTDNSTANGSRISFDNSSSTPPTLEGTIYGGTIQGSTNFTFQQLIAQGAGFATCHVKLDWKWELAKVNNSDYSLTALATYHYVLQDCSGAFTDINTFPYTTVNFGCTADHVIPLTRSVIPPVATPPPFGGTSYSLKAKKVGSALQCTLLRNTSVVQNATVYAEQKKTSSFTAWEHRKTNATGKASFSLSKIKSGTKIRCRYGTTYSSQLTR